MLFFRPTNDKNKLDLDLPKNQVKLRARTFGFDRLLGPGTIQLEVYKTTVLPIINDVVQGYNCTILAQVGLFIMLNKS
jgi:hypothetical protein